jgi:hypothetical protein
MCPITEVNDKWKRPGSDGWTVDFYKIKLRRYWYIAL